MINLLKTGDHRPPPSVSMPGLGPHSYYVRSSLPERVNAAIGYLVQEGDARMLIDVPLPGPILFIKQYQVMMPFTTLPATSVSR